jgi:multidrug efflux pump
MDRSLLALSRVVDQDLAVDHVFAYTGGNGASNAGILYISLKPLNERKVSASQIIDVSVIFWPS